MMHFPFFSAETKKDTSSTCPAVLFDDCIVKLVGIWDKVEKMSTVHCLGRCLCVTKSDTKFSWATRQHCDDVASFGQRKTNRTNFLKFASACKFAKAPDQQKCLSQNLQTHRQNIRGIGPGRSCLPPAKSDVQTFVSKNEKEPEFTILLSV